MFFLLLKNVLDRFNFGGFQMFWSDVIFIYRLTVIIFLRKYFSTSMTNIIGVAITKI